MKNILIVADEKGWAFDRHAREIKKRLTEFNIDVAYRKQNIKELSSQYDLVYVMDPIPLNYPPAHKTILGLRADWLFEEHPEGPKGLYEYGLAGRCVSIKDKCCIFHVVNRRMLEEFKDVVTDKPLVLVQHGIDEEVFDRNKYEREEHEGIVIGVAGRDSTRKRFGLIKKACDKTGCKFVSTQYGGKKLSKEEMPHFYNALDIYVCMSRSEGLNNPTMEAGSMGIPVISTKSGASREMIDKGESGLIIKGDLNSLIEAIEKLKDKSLREEMGDKFYQEIMSNWTWKVRIDDFRKMFNLYFNK